MMLNNLSIIDFIEDYKVFENANFVKLGEGLMYVIWSYSEYLQKLNSLCMYPYFTAA